MYNHKIVNAETGEEIVVPMTAEEIKVIEENIAKAEAEEAQAEANAAAKVAVLERLGITEEEAKLLLA